MWVAWCIRRADIGNSRGSKDAEQERAEIWRKHVRKHVKLITKYSMNLSIHESPAAVFPLAEQFRRERLPEDVDDMVNQARRCGTTVALFSSTHGVSCLSQVGTHAQGFAHTGYM